MRAILAICNTPAIRCTLIREAVRAGHRGQGGGELAGEALSGAAGIVGDVQRGVSRRVFGLLGPRGRAGAPRARRHRGGRQRLGADRMRAVPSGGGRALALTAPPRARRRWPTHPRGALALGALNGMWGDRIERDHAALALGMDLRHGGGETDRIAVFVHGLCETDTSWRLGGRPTYGERLREDLGHTPVYARYNTGRHISDNGRALAAALDALVAAGRSRSTSSCSSGTRWAGSSPAAPATTASATAHLDRSALRHVVCLGSPHLGAPLERAAAHGSHAALPAARDRAARRLLTVRSAGVKDLRYGACLEEDWRDIDPDEWGPDHCADFPFLPSATYYYVGATVARDKDSPLGRMIGDVLVQFPSASGDGPLRKLAFEIDHGLHLGGVNHLQLLNHPRVYEQMAGLAAARAGAHGWLARRRRPTGRASASSPSTPSRTSHSTGSSKRGSCRRARAARSAPSAASRRPRWST